MSKKPEEVQSAPVENPDDVAKAHAATEAAEAHEAEVQKLWDMLPGAERKRVLEVLIKDATDRSKKISDDFNEWQEQFDTECIKHDTWMLWAIRAGIAVCVVVSVGNFIFGNWSLGILNAINGAMFVILHKQTTADRDRHINSRISARLEKDGKAPVKEDA